jgi:hypothetical protein
VSAGVLTLAGKSYLVTLGEHKKSDTKNGVTMILDLAAGTWHAGAKRPAIGNHHASEVINNKIYLFGGLAGGEGDVQIGTLKAGGTGVDIAWTPGAPLPFASGSAATAYIGGLVRLRPSSFLCFWQPAHSARASAAHLRACRTALCSQPVCMQVYYCGGIDKANSKTLNTCASYDPKSDTWATNVPPMPEGRNHAATCTDGKKMYVFGGRSGKNVVGTGYDDTQIFTPGVGWSAGAPLPLARGGTGKAVYSGGSCFVFGGEVSTSVAPSTSLKVADQRAVYRTDIYSVAGDSWSAGKVRV